MDLRNRFQEYVAQNQLFDEKDRILLAVSGGRDSMLMTYLFLQSGFTFSVAHCNFQLRGEESEKDERLVVDFCKKNEIKCHVTHFDTEHFAKENGLSIQMAARELRYSWFDSLIHKHGYDVVAIAQHHNDQIETFFVNIFRGTGIRGLHGILPKKKRIVRPILFLEAEEVFHALKKFEIPYRDDQSNFSTDYLRNKIRLQLVPEMRKINPHFEDTMRKNIRHFQEEESVFEFFLQREREKYFTEKEQWIEIDKSVFKEYRDKLAVLYQIFKPFSFSKGVLRDVLSHLNDQPGLVFESAAYEMLLDRDMFLLRAKDHGDWKNDQVMLEGFEGEVVLEEYSLSWQHQNIQNVIVSERADTAFVDAEKLVFPLKVRKWKKGDVFIPLGMRGKKKLSDFFVDRKLSRFEKEGVKLLLNGNAEVIWVIGMRLDNRYKIEEKTKKVCTFVWKKQI